MEAMDWIEDDDETEDTGFRVTDDSAADWVLRKRNSVREQNAREREHYKRQLARIDQKDAETDEWAKMLLMPYFETLPARETKTQKSYSLPSGKLVLKRPAPAYKRDDAALCAFLIGAEMTDYVEHIDTYKPLWAALKPLTEAMNDGTVILKETGEVVGGVVAEAQDDVFVIS